MKKLYRKNNNKNQPYNIFLFLFIIIITIYCINGYRLKRYYQYYPTINIYPNNFNEIKLVEKYVHKSKNNKQMNDFIKLTDKSVTYAFENIVLESKEELDEIISITVPFIMFLKLLFNRARPAQINPELTVFNSTSAHTPAFPSGHSFQAYYLANKLSKKYPEKKTEFYELAEKCGHARIYAGLHYPSDHEFSKFLIQFL